MTKKTPTPPPRLLAYPLPKRVLRDLPDAVLIELHEYLRGLNRTRPLVAPIDRRLLDARREMERRGLVK